MLVAIPNFVYSIFSKLSNEKKQKQLEKVMRKKHKVIKTTSSPHTKKMKTRELIKIETRYKRCNDKINFKDSE